MKKINATEKQRSIVKYILTKIITAKNAVSVTKTERIKIKELKEKKKEKKKSYTRNIN